MGGEGASAGISDTQAQRYQPTISGKAKLRQSLDGGIPRLCATSRAMTHRGLISTAAEFTAWRAKPPLRPGSVRGCPRGRGEAVLVVPGLLGTDRQTKRFRDGLQMLDYVPAGWDLGLNRGPTPARLEQLAARVSQLAAAHGPIYVIGFGMGGVFARWACQARSAAVSGVLTVNTPFRDPVEQAFRRVSRLVDSFAGLDLRGLSVMVRQPPPVKWAALYARNDGVVSWNSCMDPLFPDQCVEIPSRHFTCMKNANVFRATADSLATFR